MNVPDRHGRALGFAEAPAPVERRELDLRAATADLFISVVSIGEIKRGIALKRQADPLFGSALASWLDRVLSIYGDRVLPFDLRSARRWGQLSATIGNDGADLQIAATALEHGLTVATRNVRHYAPTGVAVTNPFE